MFPVNYLNAPCVVATVIGTFHTGEIVSAPFRHNGMRVVTVRYDGTGEVHDVNVDYVHVSYAHVS